MRILPDGPQAINHGMMQEENRVLGRSEEITFRAADGVVPAAVQTEFRETVARGQGVEVAKYHGDVLGGEEGVDLGLVVVGGDDGVGERARQAPRVGRSPVRRQRRAKRGVQGKGPKRDGRVGEGARGDTIVVRRAPVAAERGGRAVPQGRVRQVGVQCPVPVGDPHGRREIAILLECLLEEVDKVPVPAEEDARKVHVVGQVDVRGREVKVAVRRGGHDAVCILGGLVHQALNAVDVGELLVICEIAILFSLCGGAVCAGLACHQLIGTASQGVRCRRG